VSQTGLAGGMVIVIVTHATPVAVPKPRPFSSVTNLQAGLEVVPTGGTSAQLAYSIDLNSWPHSYYVSQTIATTGCEGPRSEIIVTVNPRPTAPVANDAITVKMKSHYLYPCHLQTAVWYTTPTGGTQTQQTYPSTTTVGLILLCKSDNDHHRMRGTSN
jgi:hypothetical protein